MIPPDDVTSASSPRAAATGTAAESPSVVRATDYESYVLIPRLLELQRPLTAAAHDEMLFACSRIRDIPVNWLRGCATAARERMTHDGLLPARPPGNERALNPSGRASVSDESGHGGSGGEELARPAGQGSAPGTRSGRAFSTTDALRAAGRYSAYPRGMRAAMAPLPGAKISMRRQFLVLAAARR